MSAILEYQTAVFAQLNADSALMAEIEAVYDIVPQGAVAPYVYFGDVTCEDAANLAAEQCKIDFQIICVTESSGKKQAAEISDLVRKSLHLAQLSLIGYEHINTRLLNEEIELASNGINYLATLGFEAVVSG